MRKVTAGVVSLVLASGAGAAFGIAPATAAPPVNSSTSAKVSSPSDELSNPAEAKRRELRDAAIQDVIAGKAKPVTKNGSTVVKVGREASARKAGSSNARAAAAAAPKDQYVELAREKTDKIFVILAEFGNERHPNYPDRDTDPTTPGPATFEGPLHNKIPAPNRAVDNSTVWQADYNRKHYQDLYFGTGENSVASYFDKQSSGRYTVQGEVSDWVKVRYNEARYGRSDGYPCAGNVCSNTWALVQDAVNQWVLDQKAAGRTQAQITADLKTYDKWDRFDSDGDGNFDEPDGYLDHFQIVHSGGDQADGDPQQGEDAIWSHRWAVQTGFGTSGPTGNMRGGAQVGTTGLWVGDYTIQPENGGLSVFTHEYTHDLGLPDLYDTAGGENGVNWWSLMAQSRLGAKGDALGEKPGDLGAWEKLQLGWLDYEIVPAGTERTLDLGPHEYNSAKAQAVVTPLPAKTVVTQFGAPAAGSFQWYSDQGDDLNNTLTRTVALGAGTSTLSMQAKWNIEDCGPDPCDYAYVEVDPGTGFVAVPTSVSQAGDPGDTSNGIDNVQATYVPVTADLSAYAGKTVKLRLRYNTDGAYRGQDQDLGWSGFFADEIKLVSGGATVFTDGAETASGGWTPAGFIRVGASSSEDFANYYIASNRTYTSYDRYLQTGPYNFGWASTKPDYVEHFAYQQGLLVSYWDTSQSDNNASQHPGEGLILPVDSHPAPIYRLDGNVWRNRIQGYDATFSTKKADSFTLHVNGQASYIRGQAAVPTFDDRKSYWNAKLPQHSVKVPNAGVKMTVSKQSGTSMRLKITSTK